MDYGYKPTTNGRALITKCMALEKPLVLTRVAFGSGQVPEGTNLADVHEIISYVADGSIGERTHKDDRLHLTVQYDNSAHPDTPTFYLNEFIVYGQDPETSEDVDLLYRGDIFYADLEPVIGSEQGGVRPVLVIQNDIGNRHSPTVIVAAITSRIKHRHQPTHVNLNGRQCGLHSDSTIMLEQLRTLDKQRLLGYVGSVGKAKMDEVDRALEISVGTSKKPLPP